MLTSDRLAQSHAAPLPMRAQRPTLPESHPGADIPARPTPFACRWTTTERADGSAALTCRWVDPNEGERR